jgi:quercetin dioxygenase-like cupin family protein
VVHASVARRNNPREEIIMMHGTNTTSDARVLAPTEGDIARATYAEAPEGVVDRFMVDGQDSGGRVAVIEHRLAPRALAAPLHRHTNEDEFSYVLEGRVGAQLGEQEVFGEAGYLIFKPRHQWHTFWNAGDQPARILEIISPAGMEELFRLIGAHDALDPATLMEFAARYGVEIDFDRTGAIVDKHGLVF